MPPKIWKQEGEGGGAFASINRPIAGPTHDKELPIGKHPHQLYSLGTPNGVKVTIMFEELLEVGHSDAEYDAWLINIGKGDQFGSGFVDINPNSKDPGHDGSLRRAAAATPSASSNQGPFWSTWPKNSVPSCRPICAAAPRR